MLVNLRVLGRPTPRTTRQLLGYPPRAEEYQQPATDANVSYPSSDTNTHVAGAMGSGFHRRLICYIGTKPVFGRC